MKHLNIYKSRSELNQIGCCGIVGGTICDELRHQRPVTNALLDLCVNSRDFAALLPHHPAATGAYSVRATPVLTYTYDISRTSSVTKS